MPGKRLLILSCTARKRSDPGLLPAVIRYDGPAFRVFRRFRSRQGNSSVSMCVLSAEFGLIPESHPIPLYDRVMTLERASELRSPVDDALNRILTESASEEALVCVGRLYMAALPSPLPSSLAWQRLEGPPGARLARLRSWLYGAPPTLEDFRAPGAPMRIRGKEILITGEELLELARRRLAQDGDGAQRSHVWYVSVGEARVGPKWLVSQIAGLPPNFFHTDEARRVLQRLGIRVRSYS